MNRALKISLQLAFLAVLIWVLAALSGAVTGFSVQVGSRGGRGRGRRRRRGRGSRWIDTGMSGNLIATASNMPVVGVPLMRF